jgi:hypothetical protein
LSVPWFDCDESLTWRDLNSNPGHFSCFTFIFVSFGESCLLVSWCVGGKYGMAGSDEYHGRSRIHGAEDQDGRTNRVLSGRTIGRSADAVCGLHRAREDEERGFLG